MSDVPDFKKRLVALTTKNNTWKNVKRHYVPGPGKPYPEQAWLEVISQYLVLGNMRLVAAVTEVPYDLIRTWKGTPKWVEIERELRATENIHMDNKMSRIVEKSLEATLDRIEHGDFIFDQKSGKIVRKPVALRDVHRVAVELLGKREQIRDGVNKRQEGATQLSTEDQLKILAKEFAKWTDKKKSDVIELEEVEDAVYVDKNHKDDLEGDPSLAQDSGVVDGEAAPGSPDPDDEGTPRSPE